MKIVIVRVRRIVYLVDILVKLRMNEGLSEQDARFGPTHYGFRFGSSFDSSEANGA